MLYPSWRVRTSGEGYSPELYFLVWGSWGQIMKDPSLNGFYTSMVLGVFLRWCFYIFSFSFTCSLNFIDGSLPVISFSILTVANSVIH